MCFWLAQGVHATDVAGDLVFLTVEADAYFCLVGGGQYLSLRPDGGVEVAPAAAAADLVEAGLLDRKPSASRRRAPMPARTLPGVGAPPTLGLAARALGANLRASKAIATQSFDALLDLAGACSDDAFAPPSSALLEHSRQFDQISPWLPRDGVCLMRSLQQRLYLSRLGHSAAWVFGVRTWPFEAHCWLQVGDMVLDDTVEHVSGFSPIMVV
jgi:hypothetical protein